MENIHRIKGSDGISPALSVVSDSAGNLYGVAAQGGASNNGTVFELVKAANGSFTEKTLLSFNGGSGGSTPVGGLIFDNSGNLYRDNEARWGSRRRGNFSVGALLRQLDRESTSQLWCGERRAISNSEPGSG